jgi:hypothetical protein
MNTDRQRNIAEWGENVLQVTDDLIATHNFSAPRVELSLSEEMIVELITNYSYPAKVWCYKALSMLARYEITVQENIDPSITILTSGERETLDKLKGLVDLREPD